MHPPLSGPRRYFSRHSVRDNSLQEYSSFAGETIGTHIDRDSPLIMPLRLRGGFATECHASSYYAHKAHARRKQANRYRIAKMKAQFSSCGKRSTKNQSEQLQQVAVGAMGLVCDESSALIGSPPCDSDSVCERADIVYKNALNECPSIHLRALHAKHQASTRAGLRFEFLSFSF